MPPTGTWQDVIDEVAKYESATDAAAVALTRSTAKIKELVQSQAESPSKDQMLSAISDMESHLAPLAAAVTDNTEAADDGTHPTDPGAPAPVPDQPPADGGAQPAQPSPDEPAPTT